MKTVYILTMGSRETYTVHTVHAINDSIYEKIKENTQRLE